VRHNRRPGGFRPGELTTPLRSTLTRSGRVGSSVRQCTSDWRRTLPFLADSAVGANRRDALPKKEPNGRSYHRALFRVGARTSDRQQKVLASQHQAEGLLQHGSIKPRFGGHPACQAQFDGFYDQPIGGKVLDSSPQFTGPSGLARPDRPGRTGDHARRTGRRGGDRRDPLTRIPLNATPGKSVYNGEARRLGLSQCEIA
jgi:hypothetical protein